MLTIIAKFLFAIYLNGLKNYIKRRRIIKYLTPIYMCVCGVCVCVCVYTSRECLSGACPMQKLKEFTDR